LSGAWSFAFDDEDRGLAERWFERSDIFDHEIAVPYPPESRMSGIHDPDFHPVVWYRREFALNQDLVADYLKLHFGAVDYKASVWVNGRLAVEHEGGHTPFSASIESLLTDSGPQIIVVRAEDRPGDLEQPRGKQYWRERPGYIWYHRTTGIWQPVWLEPVPRVSVTQLRWTADLDRSGVELNLRFSRPVPELWRVRVRIIDGASTGTLTDDLCNIQGDYLRRSFLFNINTAVDRRRQLLWAPENPNLPDAKIQLLDE